MGLAWSIDAEGVGESAVKRTAGLLPEMAGGIDRDAAIGRVVWEVAQGLAESSVGGRLRSAMANRADASFEAIHDDITGRKHAEARLEKQATRDTLTGLPNRTWINRRVDDMPEQRHNPPARLEGFLAAESGRVV